MKIDDEQIKEFLEVPKKGSLFVSEKPKDKTFLNCDEHGKYEMKYVPFANMDNKFLIVRMCPTCANIADQEIKAINEKKKEDRIQVRLNEISYSYGISKRNLNKSFDDFVATSTEQKKAKKKCKDFADAVCFGNIQKNIIISGGLGTGKTLLCSAIVNQCVEHSKKCLFTNFIDIIREIKDTWNQDSINTESCIINKYTTSDALIIDEVGLQAGTDTEKRFIFDIIDGRYRNKLPTIIISNLGMKAIEDFIGSRVIDRLREDGGHQLVMDWESWRKNK